MYIFKEIVRFNFKSMVKNWKIHVAVLLSLIFIFAYSSDIISSDRTDLAFVIEYYHVNMVMPLIILVYSVNLFSKIAHGKMANLFDSYSYRNYQLFLGKFTSIFFFFLLYDFIQFLIILLLKINMVSNLNLLKTLVAFFTYSVPNVLFFVSIGAVFAVLIKETLYSYILVFIYQINNLRLDRFTIKPFQLIEILHTNIFKYNNYSDYGLLGADSRIFMLNRLLIISISILFISISLLNFKKQRENKSRKLYWRIAGAFLIVVFALSGMYLKTENIPVMRAQEKINNYQSVKIDLKFDFYDVKGALEEDVIKLKTNFQAANRTEKKQRLAFYLADNFAVQSLKVVDQEIEFQRKGSLITTNYYIPSEETIECEMKYEGSMQEYAQRDNSFSEYDYKIYSYISPDLVFVPGNAAWYPNTLPIYNYIPECNWIYPGREARVINFNTDIKSDLPLIADQNILYGYPELEKSIYDGIEYYHLASHRESVKSLHNLIKEKVLFINDLMPLPRIQIFEVPESLFLAGLKIEDGYGRIMLREGIIIQAKQGKLMAREELEQAIFSAWFNLSMEGFDIKGLIDDKMINNAGFNEERLPGIFDVYPIADVFRDFINYLYNLKYQPNFDGDYFLKNKLSKKWNLTDKILEALVNYYNENGIEKTKELLNTFLEVEKEGRLVNKDFIEILNIEYPQLR